MNEQENAEAVTEEAPDRQLPRNRSQVAISIAYIVLGALLFVGLEMVPMPHIVISLFTLGFRPAIVVIAVVAAVRGPIAGFLVGYLGVVFHGLLYGVVVTWTLYAVAYGVMGAIVGLARYDLASGRSLVKLIVASVIGFVITILLSVVVGLFVEGYGTLVAIGLVLLPELTVGLPTLVFLTPVIGRLWRLVMDSVKR